MVFRCKLFHHRSLCKSHIVLVSRNDFMRILLCRFLNHLKQKKTPFPSVDNERAAKNLMTTMLGVGFAQNRTPPNPSAYAPIGLPPDAGIRFPRARVPTLPVRYILPDSLYTQWVPVGYQP